MPDLSARKLPGLTGADLLVWGLAGSPRGARRVVRQLKEHTIGCATSFGGCGVAWRLTLEIKADCLTGAEGLPHTCCRPSSNLPQAWGPTASG